MARTRPVLCLAALLALATPAFGEDAPKPKKIANPEYASWAKAKVGTYVELTSVSVSMGRKSTTKATHKLVELTKGKAVVETSMVIEGMPAQYAPKPTRREIPSEIEIPAAPEVGGKPPKGKAPAIGAKEGEETVEVAGVKLKCKTIESTVKASGMTTKSKVWTSNDVPGLTVKVTSRTEGKVGDQPFTSTVTTTLTKWIKK